MIIYTQNYNILHYNKVQYIKAMTDISSKVEDSKENAFPFKLSGRDHQCHGTAVSQELYRIQKQTLLHKCCQVLYLTVC